MPEGQVLFEVSTVGTEFFFILKGKVIIAIDINDAEKQENLKKSIMEKEDLPFPPAKAPRFKSSFNGVPRSPPVSNSVIICKKTDYKYYVIHKGRMLLNVNTLPDGASFGDLALTSNKPRNATIVAGQDCYFGVLDKANFDKTIGEHTNRESEAKLQILKNLPIFSTFLEKEINTIVPELHLEKFSYRDIIVKAGRILSSLYIIRTGKVRVRLAHQVTKRMDNHNKLFLERSKEVAILNSGLNKEQRYIDVRLA